MADCFDKFKKDGTTSLECFNNFNQTKACQEYAEYVGVYDQNASIPFKCETLINENETSIPIDVFIEARLTDPLHVEIDLNPRLRPGVLGLGVNREFLESCPKNGYFGESDIECDRITGKCNVSENSDAKEADWYFGVVNMVESEYLGDPDLYNNFKEKISVGYVADQIFSYRANHTPFSEWIAMLQNEKPYTHENLKTDDTDYVDSKNDYHQNVIRPLVGSLLRRIEKTDFAKQLFEVKPQNYSHFSNLVDFKSRIKFSISLIACGFSLSEQEIIQLKKDVESLLRVQVENNYSDAQLNDISEVVYLAIDYCEKWRQPVDLSVIKFTVVAGENDAEINDKKLNQVSNLSQKEIVSLQNEAKVLLVEYFEVLYKLSTNKTLQIKDSEEIKNIKEKLYKISEDLGEENRIPLSPKHLFGITGNLWFLGDIECATELSFFLPKQTEEIFGFDLAQNTFPFVFESFGEHIFYTNFLWDNPPIMTPVARLAQPKMTKAKFALNYHYWKNVLEYDPNHLRLTYYEKSEKDKFYNPFSKNNEEYPSDFFGDFSSILGRLEFTTRLYPDLINDTKHWRQVLEKYPEYAGEIRFSFFKCYNSTPKPISKTCEEMWNDIAKAHENPQWSYTQLRNTEINKQLPQNPDYNDDILFEAGTIADVTKGKALSLARVEILENELVYAVRIRDSKKVFEIIDEFNSIFFEPNNYKLICQEVKPTFSYSCSLIHLNDEKTSLVFDKPITSIEFENAELPLTYSSFKRLTSTNTSFSYREKAYINLEATNNRSTLAENIKNRSTEFDNPLFGFFDKAKSQTKDEFYDIYYQATLQHEATHIIDSQEKGYTDEYLPTLIMIAESEDPFAIVGDHASMVFDYYENENGNYLGLNISDGYYFINNGSGLAVAEFFLRFALTHNHPAFKALKVKDEDRQLMLLDEETRKKIIKPIPSGTYQEAYWHFDQLEPEVLDQVISQLIDEIGKLTPEEIKSLAYQYAEIYR